jgi:hypothetical protein
VLAAQGPFVRLWLRIGREISELACGVAAVPNAVKSPYLGAMKAA